jgi:hypothetical protein
MRLLESRGADGFDDLANKIRALKQEADHE